MHFSFTFNTATREEYDEADADKSGEIDWEEYHAVLVGSREQGAGEGAGEGAGSRGEWRD